MRFLVRLIQHNSYSVDTSLSEILGAYGKAIRHREVRRTNQQLSGSEGKEQISRFVGGLAGALVTHTPEGTNSGADSAQSVYRYNMTEHMLQQYALDNQRDILAAANGDKAAAKRVEARREAVAMVAITGGGGVALTVGGLTLLGAAAEMVFAARLVVAGCKTNPALCLNQAGIYAADIFASEAAIGVGPLAAGTTLIVGKSRDAVTKLGRQVMVTADEALKNKAFNVQPVAELVKKDVVDSSRLSKKTADYLKETNKIINPATNKVVTEHIVVLSGKAPKTSTPNSVYEVSRVDGSKVSLIMIVRGGRFLEKIMVSNVLMVL